MRYFGVFKKRDLLLAAGLIMGMAAPQAARFAAHHVLTIMGLVMTLSCLSVKPGFFKYSGALLLKGLYGVGLSYLLLGGVILIGVELGPFNLAIRDGLILVAAMPPAVAIMPFSQELRGHDEQALIGTVAGYLAALVLIPIIAVAYWGSSPAPFRELVYMALQLIIGPLVISRVLLKLGMAERLEPLRGAITNLSFFWVVYSIIGLNRSLLLQDPLVVLPSVTLKVISTFGLGALILLLGGLAGVERSRLVSLSLLGTLKHYSLAGSLALVFFSEKAALPSVSGVPVMMIYIICLRRYLRATENSYSKEVS